jgi:hypothetical protein
MIARIDKNNSEAGHKYLNQQQINHQLILSGKIDSFSITEITSHYLLSIELPVSHFMRIST